LDAKVCKKLPLRSNKKQQFDFKNLENNETMNQKRRHLGETLREDTKSHFNIL
jgi:hypothetical protein